MHLRPGLTIAEANRICMAECRAACCRGPQYLRLTAEEVAPFKQRAAELHIPAHVLISADGSGEVRYLDHEGDRCPMLDPNTWKCRIYADRPARCRDFPDRPRPGCAISGSREEEGL